MFGLSDRELTLHDVGRLRDAVTSEKAGAIVTFTGTTRDTSQTGRPIRYLEYETYEEMAIKYMKEIADEIRTRWQVYDIAIIHRVGQVPVGGIDVLIAVSAPHRAEAFDACRYAIDQLKQVVTIWKTEVEMEVEVESTTSE
ncbi:MAG: molybdenum cofactor biosynthesis protein MoaE [Candidatus Bipolaricaulia bacterium]